MLAVDYAHESAKAGTAFAVECAAASDMAYNLIPNTVWTLDALTQVV